MGNPVIENNPKRQRRNYAGDGGTDDELLRHTQEQETVKGQRSSSSSGDYRPHTKTSAREALAQRGILLRHTIGSGCYSKVKLAHCFHRGTVAVKIINRSKGNEDFLAKFLPREMAIWRKLKHPNIISMYGSYRYNNYVYIVLEYATHGDMLNYVQHNGATEEPRAKTWTYQIADAVAYLHRRSIAHRDLKLENLVIDDGFNVKLCDFGFAKENCFDDLASTYCGSINYAPPEILRGEPYEANKADVWSVGVIVFILTTGSIPFDGDRGTRAMCKAQSSVDFKWHAMKPVSPECRDFIHYVFRYNFRLRPTIHNVRQHHWFRSTPTFHPLVAPAKSEGSITTTDTERTLKRSRRRLETQNDPRGIRRLSRESLPEQKNIHCSLYRLVPS